VSITQGIPAPPGSVDDGVPWHYGDPLGEQRALLAGAALVDLSHRDVVEVVGPDRLPWLHSLTTAHLLDLAPGDSRLVLILSPHGRVEHELHLVDTGSSCLITVEPGTGPALAQYLESMRFLMRVEVLAREDLAAVWEPVGVPDPAGRPSWLVPGEYSGGDPTPAGSDRGGDASRYAPRRPATLVGREVLMGRDALAVTVAGARPAGTWALEALRVAAAVPRLGFETDHRTLPHEVGWIGAGVHLAKGCYRGQEAVARVHNLGHAPRRLALAHLDGSTGSLPAHGDAVLAGGRVVGWVGSAAQHHELGPIATVVIKRAVDPACDLLIRVGEQSVAAAQEVVVVP
jgi:hypothetical protein